MVLLNYSADPGKVFQRNVCIYLQSTVSYSISIVTGKVVPKLQYSQVLLSVIHLGLSV